MNWQALSTISEVIAAVAVVLSLLYLARQVREASKLNASASHVQQTEATSAVFDHLHQDPSLLHVYHQGNSDPSQLDMAEKTRYVMLLANIFARYNNYYLQKQNGTIAEETWTRAVDYISSLSKQPGLHMAWPHIKNHYFSGLQTIVDAILEENQPLRAGNEASSGNT
jgi:hypothetical protein